jgi:NAD(P)-dependent dehydrogenase (short-subunit alcohol dehydrogenase family)
MTTRRTPPTALVTGGSSGLGLALARHLDDTGWIVVTDARDDLRLQEAVRGTTIHGVPGDVADAEHRAALVEIIADLGGLDLLVLNHSTLGPLPMRSLAAYEPTEIGEVFRTNAGAPGSLMIALTDQLLARDGVVVGISSDAAVQHYETWGAYGASKAALDHLVLTFGEETGLSTYAVDPGDMRTPMHQDAFPGEDISDRPLPESVVPRLLALIRQRPERGRYLASEIADHADRDALPEKEVASA